MTSETKKLECPQDINLEIDELIKQGKKFVVIYPDLPWQFGSKKYQDGDRDFIPLTDEYPTMTIEQMKNMKVKEISENDSACFMWTSYGHLKEAIEILEVWGFQYKTVAFVWVKKYESGEFCYNFAPWTIQSTEICLLGIRGQMTKHKIANNIKQLVIEVRTKHSRKPDEVRRRIDNLFGNVSKIELFAREKFESWVSLGNQINPMIQTSLSSPTLRGNP